MKVLLNNKQLNKVLKNNKNLNFVPTMGSLHEGHISLIKKSKTKSKNTIVSIFVNPDQFNSKKDFRNYPRNINKDISILKKLKVEYLYMPNTKEIYDKSYKIKIKIARKHKVLCAKFRKGHFEGVLKVMDRLTNLIKPKKIFMGEKDYQQFILVKSFLEKKYKTKVVLCKTIRDYRGLALSSRNRLLKKSQISLAQNISINLRKIKNNLKNLKNVKKRLNEYKKFIEKKYDIKIQYLELRNIKNLKISKNLKKSKLFVAYYLDGVRLIDNY